MTEVVNVKVQYIRKKGYSDLKDWIEDENNVYIGRKGVVFVTIDGKKQRFPQVSSLFANPFKIKTGVQRETVIRQYEEMIRSSPELLEKLPLLKGKVLGCWCKPEPCHGDVLVKLLQELE